VIKLFALENANIQDTGPDGGAARSEDQVLGKYTYNNHFFSSAWDEHETLFTDVEKETGVKGGKGINLLSQWAVNANALAAYVPQRLTTQVLRSGTTTSMTTDNNHKFTLKCHDGLSLFNVAHPYNYKRASLGNYANLFTGSPSSTNPGFLPLAGPFVKSSGAWVYSANDLVSPQDASTNLWKAITWIAGIRQDDGITPAYLKPDLIVSGAALREMVTTITRAQFISTNWGSGTGGSTEIKSVMTTLGLNEPIFLNEMTGTGTNEDYDWYLFCTGHIARAELGPIIYAPNQPWNVNIYTSANIPELRIKKRVQALGEMRSLCGVGYPKYVFHIRAPNTSNQAR
jgi:hypothetical protein